MFKFVLILVVGLFALGSPALAASHRKAVKQTQQSSKSAPRKSKKTTTVASGRSAGKSRAAKASRSKSSRASARRHKQTRSTSARRYYQQSPTPERYREIQQALADKGYFRGEVNGQWGSDSVVALRRFQREQNLNETGKLDSVSLIALGLGPKRSLTARSNPDTEQARPQDDNRRSQGSERP